MSPRTFPWSQLRDGPNLHPSRSSLLHKVSGEQPRAAKAGFSCTASSALSDTNATPGARRAELPYPSSQAILSAGWAAGCRLQPDELARLGSVVDLHLNWPVVPGSPGFRRGKPTTSMFQQVGRLRILAETVWCDATAALPDHCPPEPGPIHNGPPLQEIQVPKVVPQPVPSRLLRPVA